MEMLKIDSKGSQPVNAAPISAEAQVDLAAFKEDWKNFLRAAINHEQPVDMIKYLYSPTVCQSYNDKGTLIENSGEDFWNDVTNFEDRYYIPKDEAKIIRRNQAFLSNLFVRPPVNIALGPGGFQAMATKDIPTLKAVRADTFVGFDINENFARSSAQQVQMANIGVATKFIHGDFTKPLKLDVTPPILITMFGCTLTQFSLTKAPGEVTCTELLKNIGEMVDHKAIMLATIDTNQNHESAKDCYSGEHMKQFQRHLWLTAKTLIESSPNAAENFVAVEGDRTANPADAVIYDPRYEKDGIVHSYIVKKAMTFVIDGQRFELPPGLQVDSGYSKRSSITDIIKAVNKTGCWTVAHELSDNGSSVRALVLAGTNVSKTQLARAQGRVTAARRRSVANASSRTAPVALAPFARFPKMANG